MYLFDTIGTHNQSCESVCNCLIVHQILSRVFFLDIFCMLVFFLVTILGLLVCSLFLRNNMQKHSVFSKTTFWGSFQ